MVLISKGPTNIKRIRFKRAWLSTFVCLFLYIGVFFGTFTYTSLSTNVEQGWEYALASFRHHPEQSYGNGIYYTYGPLSPHVVTIVHSLDTAHNFIISILIVSAVLALCLFGLLRAFKHNGNKTKLLCLGVFAVAVSCSLNIDLSIDVLFYSTLIATYSYLAEENKYKYKLGAALGLILLSTYKNSFLIALLPVLAIIGLTYPAKNWFRRILGTVLLVFLPILILVIDGVSTSGIPRYLWYSLNNSLAYSQFMNNTLHPKIVIAFWLLFIIYTTTKIVKLLLKRSKNLKLVYAKPHLPQVALVVGELWIIYVVLKEAITRSDQHLIVFLPFVLWILVSLLFQLRFFSQVSSQKLILIFIILLAPTLLVTESINERLDTLTRSQTLNTILDQVTLRDVLKYYSYDSFLEAKQQSQVVTNAINNQAKTLRNSFISYLQENQLRPGDQSIVGLNNDIFYLPAFRPVQYLYAPSLQNFEAQPTTLYDRIDLNYIENHPNYYIFWDTTVPSIDGRLPSEDLPMTYNYIQNRYSIVASDSVKGLYLLGKSHGVLSKNVCSSSTTVGHLGTMTKISGTTTELKVNIQTSSLYKLKYLAYKYPIYTMQLKDGRQDESFRAIPSSLSDGLYIRPWLPLLTGNGVGQNFTPNQFKLSSSDNSKPSLKLTQMACVS